MSIAERPTNFEWSAETGFVSDEHPTADPDVWKYYSGRHSPTQELPEADKPTQPVAVQPTEPLTAQRAWSSAKTAQGRRAESRAARDALYGWAAQKDAPGQNYSRELAAAMDRHQQRPDVVMSPVHGWRKHPELSGVPVGFDRSQYHFNDATQGGPSMIWTGLDLGARAAVRGGLHLSAAIDDRRSQRAQRNPAAGREVSALKDQSRVRDMTPEGSEIGVPKMTTIGQEGTPTQAEALNSRRELSASPD